jgi:hypothetical protein
MVSGRSPSGRAGGPADLSRSASQPKALIPNAKKLTAVQLTVLRAAAATGDATNARDIESRRVRTRTIASLQADGLLYGFHGVERTVPITPAGLAALEKVSV